jgi:hypothetical protein
VDSVLQAWREGKVPMVKPLGPDGTFQLELSIAQLPRADVLLTRRDNAPVRTGQLLIKSGGIVYF